MGMTHRHIRKKQMTKIYESLLKLQSELPKAINDSNNPAWKSKYISLQQLLNLVTTTIHKNGFCIITKSGKDEFGHFCETMLVHSTGEAIPSRQYLELGSKVNMQGIGAANTYARRTGLMQLLGITSYDQNDDDANQFDPDVENYTKYKNKLENSSKEQLKENIDSIKISIDDLSNFNPKWGAELNAILNMRMK